LVEQNLPSAKVVTGATNATPIVVTTSTAHNLQTNEIIQIADVSGNTAANGTFVAQVLSSTTVALTAYPARTNVAGSGAYTFGGALQSLGFGVTVPVPNDLTDMMLAGSVNVPHEAELDRLAWLLYQQWLSLGKFARVPVVTIQQATGTTVSWGGGAIETITNTTGIGTASTVYTVSFSGVTTGDRLIVNAAFDAGTSGGIILARIYATIGASATQVPGCATEYNTAGASRSRTVMSGSWTATSSGSMDVTLYVSAGVGDTWSNYGTGGLTAELIKLGV
jgi:hypothetical protein